MTKKAANYQHFKKRLWQRYGLEINRKELVELQHLIQTSGGKYRIDRQSNTRVLHKIPFKGHELIVVYSNVQHNFVTVLPNVENI